MCKEPYFEWNEADGQALCIIEDNQGRLFIGTATCHENDRDMMNRRTGEEIAYRRAKIENLKTIRADLKLQLKALNQLYYSMNTSKHFNSKSYENKMLQRQLRAKNFDLATIKEMLATEQENLRTFLTEKEEFYKKVRSHRNKAKSD